jgi:hypothetical protein
MKAGFTLSLCNNRSSISRDTSDHEMHQMQCCTSPGKHLMSLLQKGHVTTAAQQTQRAIDGNLCVPGVSAVSFCSGGAFLCSDLRIMLHCA